MKFLYALPLFLALSACSSVDPQVKLLGEYNDHKSENRWEVYIRVVNISDPSRLKHREEPLFLTEGETRRFVVEIKKEEEERSLTESAVQKDIDAGRRLRLPEEDTVRKSPPIRLEPKDDK